MKLKSLIAMLLMMFTTTVMAEYCDTQRSPTQCYNNVIDSTITQIKGNFQALMQSDALTEQEKDELRNNQTEWWDEVRLNCSGNHRCIYQNLSERNLQIFKYIKQLQSAPPVVTTTQSTNEDCPMSWVQAYQAEVGEDAMVSSEQYDEWVSWCAAGKTP